MAKIFTVFGKAGAARLLDPLGRRLLRLGVTPDTVTVLGTLGVLVGTFGFAARGKLLAAVVIVTLSGLADLLDGAMARARGRTSRFGAFLDSTMDRVADGAVFASLAFWLGRTDRPAAAAAALLCLVAGQIVSYAKARAEGLGMTCNVGIAERPERLIIIGVGALLAVFTTPYALDVALWLLAVLSVVTIGQRMVHVYRQDGRTSE